MPGTPSLVRIGEIVGGATVASLLAAAPGALRLASTADVGVIHAWLTLAGILLVPMLVLVPLVRLARNGLLGFLPQTESRSLERGAAMSLFACTWLWLLSACGAALRATTHQRALGAVTFAVLAVGSMLALGFVALRLVTILVNLRQRSRQLGTGVALSIVALSLALVALRVGHAAPALPFEARATLIDAFAWALALAFTARKAIEEQRILARWGPPIGVCLLVVAVHTVITGPNVLEGMERGCPLYVAIVSVVRA